MQIKNVKVRIIELYKTVTDYSQNITKTTKKLFFRKKLLIIPAFF